MRSILIVAYLIDNGPVQYYYYDRNKGQAKFLFTNRKGLEGIHLAKMHPVIIKSRDNLDMVSYYTLPLNNSKDDVMPNKPLPMILCPWRTLGPAMSGDTIRFING